MVFSLCELPLVMLKLVIDLLTSWKGMDAGDAGAMLLES